MELRSVFAVIVVSFLVSCATTPRSPEALLSYSAERGDVNTARQLIADGVDIDARDKNRSTPLMAASYFGHKEIVHLLLDGEADLELTDNMGRTALMYASEAGNTDIAELLILQGADIDVRDNEGLTALTIGCYFEQLEIVELLLTQNAEMDMYSDDGFTPLMSAAFRGNLELLSLLLQYGADVDAPGQNDSTALMMAAYNGHREIADQLIQAGADIDAKTTGGSSAYAIAVENNDDEMVKVILSGMVMTALEKEESTYLPFPVTSNTIEEMSSLLQAEDTSPAPYALVAADELEIPEHVRYIENSRRENERILDDFLSGLSDPSSISNVQGTAPFIVGPHLTTLLKRADLLADLQYQKVAGITPDREPFATFSIGIHERSSERVLYMIRNILFSADALSVRMPSATELRWYWATISYDIEEPIFIFESGGHTTLADFDKETGKLFYIDLLDGLNYPPN